MKKLVVGTFLTLDGVMQAPGNPQEDTEGGFVHGGWQMPYFDADAGKLMGEQMAATDALLLGRVTYEIFAGYWPNAPEDDPMAQRLNSMPKYVWSTVLARIKWNNAMLMKGDIEEEVNKLKRQPGSGMLAVIGSGELVRSLMRHGLVDEYKLWVHPLVIGSGKRLFGEGVGPLHLTLVDAQTTTSGIAVLTYQPVAQA